MRQANSEKVRKRIGNPSRATFYRIRTDASLNFPKPIAIRGRLMWDLGEIDAWLADRARVVTLPARKVKAPKRPRPPSILTAERVAA